MRAGNGSAGIFARACSGRPHPAFPLRNEKNPERRRALRSGKGAAPESFGRAGEKPEKTARQESKIPLNPAPPPQSEARLPRPAGSRDESNS